MPLTHRWRPGLGLPAAVLVLSKAQKFENQTLFSSLGFHLNLESIKTVSWTISVENLQNTSNLFNATQKIKATLKVLERFTLSLKLCIMYLLYLVPFHATIHPGY